MGWACQGAFCLAGLDATLLWFSGFILRAPIQTWLQYRRVDKGRSRLALGWAFVLVLTAACAGLDFWMRAPGMAKTLAVEAGFPLGLALLTLAFIKRNLRHWLIEALGFTGLGLLTPVLALMATKPNLPKIIWLSSLLTAYFILSIGYVKLRQNWLARSRKGERWDALKRFGEGKWILLFHIVFLLIAVFGAPGWAWGLAPGWAFLRVLAGVSYGKTSLPLMKLGMREMAHSAVFALLLMGAWLIG